MQNYKKNSLSLVGAISMGTNVMIGAGIFALLGQVAELSGKYFPIAFIVGGIISGFSAYSYIKMSNAFPSAGGIAMYLEKAYGKGIITAFAALLMTFSMIINESLVARTFGTYTLQLFDAQDNKFLVPALGVGLLIIAFLINILGNKVIGKSSLIMAILKTGGLLIFAGGAIYASGFVATDLVPSGPPQNGIMEYMGALALSILAYKGFTTITNSGGEIVNPHKNVSRTIVISLLICAVTYLLVSWGVISNLSIPEIIEAKDYSLAEASRPLFGKFGLWFTVAIAIVATVSGVIASIFAVSRMTTMLTDMKLIPHSHFGMSGSIQKHMLVYIVVIAIVLTIFFDLTRIASLGAIYYLVMDIIVHWGVLRNLKNKIDFKPGIVIAALVLDAVVLFSFIWIKIEKDPLLIAIAAGSILIIFFAEKWFLNKKSDEKSMTD
ncbi:amino acid/polyamine/organocation transporter, APC superfamily [Salegentibacter echinorum]|uniref:Amino acid/polyamine/organocation transporter, APC superfamily n=1 Tax=Salegentibacter echinorum TaxID=1073325 RepID=A0A1M5BJG6_SALEC|nr:APC family permease [Salegentibacter echinorum]SHF42714.1 amino acid/polyamine/organocation transporter, APC superfamily [Salegentibacter echinorum]